MQIYVIFLRGVTPTGKNRVPMAALRAALANAGLLDIQTYIQSGNVIARSDLDQTSIQSLVHQIIARKIGADLAVIARTHPQIKRILASNPFPPDAASRTYYSLLKSTPAAPLVEALRRLDFSPDKVQLADNTIYTLYATKYSDSKFNHNFFERKLKIAATTRNFNTMSRLLELSVESMFG
jgi:uncharacterized protein (DUF1697 family)